MSSTEDFVLLAVFSFLATEVRFETKLGAIFGDIIFLHCKEIQIDCNLDRIGLKWYISKEIITKVLGTKVKCVSPISGPRFSSWRPV